jgi:hypothetical protein
MMVVAAVSSHFTASSDGVAGSSSTSSGSETFLLDKWERRCESCQLLMFNLDLLVDTWKEEQNSTQPHVRDIYGEMCKMSRLETLASTGTLKWKNGFEIGAEHSTAAEVDFLKRTSELCELIPTGKFAAQTESEVALAQEAVHNADLRMISLQGLMQEKLVAGDGPAKGWAGKPLDRWAKHEKIYFKRACIFQSELCTDDGLEASMFAFGDAKGDGLRGTQAKKQAAKDAAAAEEAAVKADAQKKDRDFLGAMGGK